MFADALLDSGINHSRRGWATLTSFGLQAIAVACLLIVPLFYTQVLPLLQTPVHIINTPIGEAPVRQITSSQPAGGGPSIFTVIRRDAFHSPTQVPRGINAGPDAAPPDIPFGSGNGTGSTETGIDGVWGGTGQAQVALPVRPVTPPPLRVSAMMEGRLIHRVEPIYPAIARTARIEGSVLIAAVIGRDGAVEKLQVVGGPPLLVRAAIDAVSQWRYRPYMLNGSSIEVDTQVTVNFILAK